MSDRPSDKRVTSTQESLQPQRIGKEEKAYQSVLDIEERLQKGDATNIALTGPYGSGKSSVLMSLKEDYPEHNYLSISLATLQPIADELLKVKPEAKKGKEEGDDEITKQNLDRLIEYSILQQLIYREKQDTLPNSRLKRIFHLSDNKVRVIAMGTIGVILALIILFEPEKLRVEWLYSLLEIEWLNIGADILSILYLAVYAYYSLAKIVPALSNSRLNKLNLKSGEIEIVKNTSIFNKHLDEILYFFEMTEYNVVILEDLDRFGSTDIFLKLRELNLLLNESKVVDRKIFFIYAVRDDMFQDADRVKCFDYITTVIPIINRSNAKNQLKEELRKRGVTEINDKDLKELGFFLNDMRLLKNITNEYVQYREKLAKGVGPEKLLAMIIYKNYYPKDFASLHDCDGVVYKLLNLKGIFISAKIKAIEDEEKRMQELLLRHQKEMHLREEELRRIYVEAYRDKVGNSAQKLKIEENFYTLPDIAKSEKLFDKLRAQSNVTYSYTTYYYSSPRTQTDNKNIPFNDIEKTVNASMSYSERLEALRSDFRTLDILKDNDLKKDDIRSLSLSRIMNEVEYSSQPKYQELRVPRLIEYLVVKGYIDENYYDYISYFYGNFIDAHDWEFVLDVKLGKAHDYDYLINDVEACLTEIPNSAYRDKAILNIYIVDYLAIKNKDRLNERRLQIILRTAIENKKFDFLTSYYQNGHQQDFVFGLLFTEYKNLWGEFCQYNDNQSNLKLIWYKYAEKSQSHKPSQEWLSENYGFVTDNLIYIDEQHWNLLIEEHPYRFRELNESSGIIIKKVVEKNAYELNKKNVEIILTCLLNAKYDTASYRLVLETENETLIKRVEEELEYCMKSVFSAPESKKETNEAIVKILEAGKGSAEVKIEYLRNQENKIDLAEFDYGEVKTLALKCDVVESSWENVVHYLNEVSEKKADETIINFVNKHAGELSIQRIDKLVKEDVQNLLAQFVSTNNLTFEAFTKIVECFDTWYYESGVPAIEERRAMVLNEKGMLHYTDKNTKSIIEQYSATLVIAYLLKHKRDWLKKPEDVAYDTDIAIGLIKSSLTISEKTVLISCFDADIVNSELADEIIRILSRQEIKLDVNFLLKVMKLTNLTGERIRVLNYTLEKNAFDEDLITAFIETLHFPYKCIAEKGKKPEIPSDEESWRLVKLLKDNDYISSYSETKKGIRVNTKLK